MYSWYLNLSPILKTSEIFKYLIHHIIQLNDIWVRLWRRKEKKIGKKILRKTQKKMKTGKTLNNVNLMLLERVKNEDIGGENHAKEEES